MRVRSRTRRANKWIVHQFYFILRHYYHRRRSLSAIVNAYVRFAFTTAAYKREKSRHRSPSSDGDLRRIRSRRFVRGIWIWQLVILDDSFDYLSARYARRAWAIWRSPLCPSLSVLSLCFLAGLQTVATPSHLWIISQYDVLCVCHTDAFE